jgi:glycosyltransferase involved in cell wall biosynthesis
MAKVKRRIESANYGAEQLPKVSAIVPCYNSMSFLQKTLDCLTAQSWLNMEIIIGDDCSTDNTLEVIRRFAKTHPNTRVIERKENLGWLKNSNDLMAEATGDFVFFAFHDDLIGPTYVEKLAEALIANPAAILAYSDLRVFQPDMSEETLSNTAICGQHGTLYRAFTILRFQSWWVPNRGLFRRQAFHEIGGIKPNLQGEFSADWTWLLHMSLLGEFVRVPEVLCNKFLKSTSLSLSWQHSAEQLEALRLAGISEIRGSKISAFQKLVLLTYLKTPGLRGWIRQCLQMFQRRTKD